MIGLFFSFFSCFYLLAEIEIVRLFLSLSNKLSNLPCCTAYIIYCTLHYLIIIGIILKDIAHKLDNQKRLCSIFHAQKKQNGNFSGVLCQVSCTQ